MTKKEELINLLEFLDFEKVIDDSMGIIYTKYFKYSKMQFIFQHNVDLVLKKYFFNDNEELNESAYHEASLLLDVIELAFKYDIRKKKISKIIF